jgi:hypothetical protein
MKQDWPRIVDFTVYIERMSLHALSPAGSIIPLVLVKLS